MTRQPEGAARRGEARLGPVDRSGIERLGAELFSESRQAALARVLGTTMSPERFAQVTFSAVVKNNDLRHCTPESIVVAVMEAAELGFAPTGQLNRAYLVPYRNKDKGGAIEAKLILGYAGLEDLARESGYVRHIWTRLVYEGDDFSVREGSERRLDHTPHFDTEDPRKIRLAYAMARFADGGLDWEIMTKAQVDAIRAKSKAPNGTAWVGSYGQMARKTAVRRFVNNLPLTNRAQAAIATDDEREYGEDRQALLAEPSGGTAQRIRARIEARQPVSDGPGAAEAPEVDDDATPEPVEPEASPDVATEPETCASMSPYDPPSACFLPAGHAGPHRNGDKESW